MHTVSEHVVLLQNLNRMLRKWQRQMIVSRLFFCYIVCTTSKCLTVCSCLYCQCIMQLSCVVYWPV